MFFPGFVAVGNFITRGFPRLARRRIRPTMLAAVLIFLPAVVSCLAVRLDPELIHAVPGQRLLETERQRLANLQGEYRGNFTFTVEESPRKALEFIGGNVKGAFLSVLGGAIFCLPGMLLLIFEGCYLGILSGLMWNHQIATLGEYYSLILTHGVMEFTAMILAGGAGLLVGWILISPGLVGRGQALRNAMGDALGMFTGAVALFIVAGLLEAFVTPHFSALVRWSVAGSSALFVIGYFGWAGRSGDPEIPRRAHASTLTQ